MYSTLANTGRLSSVDLILHHHLLGWPYNTPEYAQRLKIGGYSSHVHFTFHMHITNGEILKQVHLDIWLLIGRDSDIVQSVAWDLDREWRLSIDNVYLKWTLP